MIEIGSLRDGDYADWRRLVQGYNDFYETVWPAGTYERVWRRLRADVDARPCRTRRRARHRQRSLSVPRQRLAGGRLLPAGPVCRRDVRGKGTARALIEAVAAAAGKQGASRFYWQTKQDNARARVLYDKVARFNGFIRYDYPLG